MKYANFVLCGCVLCFSTTNVLAKKVMSEEEIIISASHVDRVIGQIGHSAYIIGSESITTEPTRSLGDNLDELVGVASSSYGTAVGQPIIRGLSGSRIRVLSNGKAVTDISSLGADHINDVDLNQITQIEIVRGPSSLLYANGTIGGIINLVDSAIARKDFDNHHFSLSFDAQSVNQGYRGSFGYKGHLNGLNLSIATSSFEHESYDIPEMSVREFPEQQNLPNSDNSNTSSKIGFSGSGDWGYAGFSYSDINSVYGIPVHEEGEDEHGHEEEEENERIFSTTNQNVAVIESSFTVGSESLRQVDFHLQLAQYTLVERHADMPSEFTSFNNDASEIAIRFDFSSDEMIHKLSLRYNDEEVSTQGEESFLGEANSNELALGYFLSNVTDILRVDYGIQYASTERQGLSATDHDVINTSVSFDSTVAEGIHVIVDLSSVARAPSAIELFALGPHLVTQRYEIGNQDLVEERSNNIDLSFTFEVDKFFANISFFANQFENYIYLEDQTEEEDGLIVARHFQNNAMFEGYELYFSGKVPVSGGDITLSVSRDEVIGRFIDDNSFIPRLTPARNFVTFVYEDTNDYSVSFTISNVESQTRTAIRETSTDGYTTLDFKYFHTISLSGSSNLALSVYAKNITDEISRQHTSFIKDEAPLPGRNIGMTLNFTF